MDLLATIPLLVGAIIGMGVTAMDSLAERVLAIVFATLLIGGVTTFTVTAFGWLWLKHSVGDLLHPQPRPARP